jgi:hypothetical protein
MTIRDRPLENYIGRPKSAVTIIEIYRGINRRIAKYYVWKSNLTD